MDDETWTAGGVRSRQAGGGRRGAAGAACSFAAAALFVLCVLWAGALRVEGAGLGEGWERLDETELQAMSARSFYVKLGATEVIYHVSPSGSEARVHYPSMAYRAHYRRKVEGATHCYHPAELPFTGWRCYSVWRKGDALREVPVG